MRKRIKHQLTKIDTPYTELEEETINDQTYLNLLVDDLKKEAENMPVYSLWSELVKKCLLAEENKN